jgi:uncharacterized protein
MSQENVNVIRGLYETFAKGDVPTIIAALDAKVEWWEAENFIYADNNNPYVGPDGVLTGSSCGSAMNGKLVGFGFAA